MTPPTTATATASIDAPASGASIELGLAINGQAQKMVVPPTRRLLDLLREDLGLTGTKTGCGIGRCGACLVWLDGEPVNACLVMAWQLQDRAVTTIEAVAADPAHAAVGEAMARCGGVQCGYCAPGMVMMVSHLNQLTPRPDADAALASMNGQLCRCTGYAGLTRAVRALFPARGV
jgi:carbon-monoxide dehydrogenase small subunit